jgi:precorrin-6Y C5,15-methyltransferase (decarboxylating)
MSSAVNDAKKIYIIGIGDDGPAGFTEEARLRVAAADLLIGAATLTASLQDCDADRWDPEGDFQAVLDKIAKHAADDVVVLASGDPLFYGVARFLCDHLGKDRFEVIPHVSSMQLAFARVKESWDEAYLTNLATQDPGRVVERIRTAEKVGVFTTEEVTPATLAQLCLDRNIDYFTAYVCENLGSPDERVTQGTLADVAGQEFSSLNVMVLVREAGAPDRPAASVGRRLFGNPDELFLQSQPKRGLLTPAEVRSMALAEMDLGTNSIVWDIGAGSGSVAIEASQIASEGRVYAVEMDAEDFALIGENAERFAATGVFPVLGRAPEAWESLPDPDAIFVGGTGRQIKQIVKEAFSRLRIGGRLVASVASLENLCAVLETLKKAGAETNCWMIQISRGNPQLVDIRFETMNPHYLVSATREA